ncbi:phospholipid scramblase 1-like [Rhinophrynus dorsalis]
MAGPPLAPPGLEYLLQVDQVYVKQTRSSAFQTYCTYDLLTSDGRLMYRAEEDRECCGPQFNVKVRNLQGHNVLYLLLPSSFCSWETQMQVSSGNGMILGYIDKKWASLTSSFTILSSNGERMLKVHGPGWGSGFMSDVNYKVSMYDDSRVFAVITRVWRGIGREMISVNDHYNVKFPLDLDVSLKGLLVATAMYIDFLHYEERNRN